MREGAGWGALHSAGSSGLGTHAGVAQRDHTTHVFQTHMSTCMHGSMHTLNIHVPEDRTGDGDESHWLNFLTGSGVVTSHPPSGSWELVTRRGCRMS